MRRILLIAAAAAIAVSAHAEERFKVSPIGIYGIWLGAQGKLPETCKSDGFVMSFGAVNDKAFRLVVGQRVNGVKTSEVITDYKVVEPPATAPIKLEIFLSSEKGDLGIDYINGSTLEIVPAGPDKTYPTTTLYLRRCQSG